MQRRAAGTPEGSAGTRRRKREGDERSDGVEERLEGRIGEEMRGEEDEKRAREKICEGILMREGRAENCCGENGRERDRVREAKGREDFEGG